MRKRDKKVISSFMVFIIALCICLNGSLFKENHIVDAISKKNASMKSSYDQNDVEESCHTIWVVGDSTAAAFTDAYYYPRYGWATQFQDFVDMDQYEVEDLAISGSSSKSFTEFDEYQTLLEGMSEGDYLFIGFGHNDEKKEDEKYTNPNGDYTTKGSFAYYLYNNYIEPALDSGCTPILCTPIVRRETGSTWKNTQLHITSYKKGYEGGDYSQAIRDLGDELDIPVIDLTSMTKALYDELGRDETIYLHAWISYKPNSVDNTHTNIYGATYNAYLVAKTVASLDLPGLSEAIYTDQIAYAPVKEDCLVTNQNYIKKVTRMG